MTATWLADALRAGGCTVDETIVPDWKNRGHTDGPFTPIGVLGHHTAGPATGDLPSLRTVRDGRPGLDGPLSNVMLSRSGVWVPIAAGRCWHAGAGSCPWVPGDDGNGYLLGIEAESAGTGDWTPAQLDAYPQGVAALLAHLDARENRFLGHLEWAPLRKIDPAGWPGGMNGFRATVAAVLNGDDMPSADEIAKAVWEYPVKHTLATPAPAGYMLVEARQFGSGISKAVAALAAKDPGQISAADIAAAIPADIAQQVVDALLARLKS